MRRYFPVVLALTLMPVALLAQQKPAAATKSAGNAAKLADAMAAAPAGVAANATIMDWAADGKSKPALLKKGTNAYTCFPDMPQTPGHDPMCIDAQWQAWADAYTAHKPPHLTAVGVGYMLTDKEDGSNTDPWAKGPTPTNQWQHYGPHIMIVVPSAAELAGVSSDPKNGGAWVMWKGTPYAHIMIPTSK